MATTAHVTPSRSSGEDDGLENMEKIQSGHGGDQNRNGDESPIVFLDRNTPSREFVPRRLSPLRLYHQDSTSEAHEPAADNAASREDQNKDDQEEVSFDDTIDSFVSDGENEFSEPVFPRFKNGEECILLYKGCACKARITDIQEKEGVRQYNVTFKYCIWTLHSFVRFDEELDKLFKLKPETPMTPDTPIQTPGEGVFPDDFMGPSPPKDPSTNSNTNPSLSGQPNNSQIPAPKKKRVYQKRTTNESSNQKIRNYPRAAKKQTEDLIRTKTGKPAKSSEDSSSNRAPPHSPPPKKSH